MSGASSSDRKVANRPAGRSPWFTLLIGAALAGLVALFGKVFLDQPLCPTSFSQAQVDASNCVVGANIGLGLVWLMAIGILISSLVVTVVQIVVQRQRSRQIGGGGNGTGSLAKEPQPAATASYPHPLIAAVLVIAIFIACQTIAVFGLSVASSLTGGNATATTVFGSQIVAQFLYILLAEALTLATLAYYCKRRGLTRRDFGLVKPAMIDVGWAIGAFVVYFIATATVSQIAAGLIPSLDIDQPQDIGFDGAAGIVPLSLVFVALVLLAPFTEEVLFRGFLFGAARRYWRYGASVLLTSLLFAALHLGGGEQGAGLLWIAAIDTFILSVALCYVREKTDRIWASVLLHSIKNGIAFTALFIFAVNR